MLDNALSSINNADSYYFQLYPISLSISNPNCDLPASGTTYRFTILKGKSTLIKANKSSMRPNYP
jgi:hypothetical protein